MTKDQKKAMKTRKVASKNWLKSVLSNLGESYTKDIAD